MLEGQGGGEMQTSSCCIASPIASFAVLYQAHGCWCFYNSFYVSKIYKERPGSFLSAFCWAQNLLQEVHEVVQHMSWASRLFWCGAELSKMTLATVEGYCIGMCLGALLPVCVIDRQTLDTFLCKIYWEVYEKSKLSLNLEPLGIKWECPCLKLSSICNPAGTIYACYYLIIFKYI